jgi:hypothetical protein
VQFPASRPGGSNRRGQIRVWTQITRLDWGGFRREDRAMIAFPALTGELVSGVPWMSTGASSFSCTVIVLVAGAVSLTCREAARLEAVNRKTMHVLRFL